MKIAGIFRGFPGLGRVVSGVELVTHFKDNYNAVIRVFSYLQGEKYLKQKGFMTNHSVSEHDFSSIGIIPVSAFGEYIFNQIADFLKLSGRYTGNDLSYNGEKNQYVHSGT